MILPDVNVWLAAVWARHADHPTARDWFTRLDEDIAFCRVTESALLRLLTNRAVTGEDVRSRRQAWDIVTTLQGDPRVRFVNEPRGLGQLWVALSKKDDRSHLLWTDDYLAAFAQAADLQLVTLDRKMHARYPSARVKVLR